MGADQDIKRLDARISNMEAAQGAGAFATRVADSIGQAGSPKSAFPLDAEQIVRLAGSILAQVLNANRHPDAKAVRVDDTIIALGVATGVPLSVDESGFHARLLPYGTVTQPASDGQHSQEPGGSREA